MSSSQEKISTLELKVDLNCPKCYNKIRKVLCQFRCKIRSQTFDIKNNLVIISGFFDPDCFSKKLCCKAGEVIKSIKIAKDKKQQPPPPDLLPPPPPPPPPPPYDWWCRPGTMPCYCGCGGSVEPCYCGCGGVREPCYCGCGGRRVAAEPMVLYCLCGRRLPCYCGCGGASYCYDESPSPCSIM